MKRLLQNLTGENDNHILPFLWVHGEDADTLRAKLAEVYASGIRAVCVEARPHKDFNGPKWFEDLGVILEECKRLGMKMWLLDDSHFPTGFANGEVKKNHPALCKKYLCLKTYDQVGPVPCSGANLKYALRSPADVVLGVYLQKRLGFEAVDPGQTLDATATLHEVDDYNTGRPNTDLMGNLLPGVQGRTPFVTYDLPAGDWCLNVLTVSYKGGEKETEGYLNPIVPEATDILLNTVYQPVYDHFSDEFGKTFMGFFSDEPRFGNIHGAENAAIGRNSAMNLPWRDDMPALLAAHCQKLGGCLAGMTEEKLLTLLPLLFINGADADNALAHALRYAYMDLVSALYSEHFDGRIAAWCHAHNCQRIGHCIEDNGAYSRLGYGAGHIWRAMDHADMAGIDVVIHQLTPGQDKGMFKGMHSPGWDGKMFTYLLGKLGGSFAHMDPAKRGRCMCELFGAYGWAEGTRLMKWLADYMLVRGVNELVPHAFDGAAFPDGDCPPHFGADGHDPLSREFRLLMDYCNRMAHLLSGGTACPDVALYLNVEGEWCGGYMPTEDAAAVLAQNLIGYDLISADFLAKAGVEDGKLVINGMRLNALVLPWAEALPASLLRDVQRLADGGVPVLFVDRLPARSVEGDPVSLTGVQVVPLAELPDALRGLGAAALTPDCRQPALRSYHYRQPDGDVYLFVNESPVERVQAVLEGGKNGPACVYDAFENRLTAATDAFTLDLPPYGSKVVLVTDTPLEAQPDAGFVPGEKLALTACTLALAPHGETAFDAEQALERPVYVSGLPGYETFAGRIRYTFTVTLTAEQAARPARLVLDGVRESAAVTVNGRSCGTRICPDYVFAVAGLQAGDNTVQVELGTTLGRAMNDFLSSFLPMEPTGMTGAVLELG